MPWFPPEDSRLSALAPTFPTRRPNTPTQSTSTLGRMPLAPTHAVPMEAEVVARADFLHVMLRAALGANYRVPVTNPAYILDIGCGSGRWVREMASEFPGARVVGLDITPPVESSPGVSGVYATASGRERSYAYVQHNALEPLTFAPASFDLTHMRQMMRVLPVAAWPKVVGEMARVTAPGGWIELVEEDFVRNGGPALDTIQRWAFQTMLPQGLDPRRSSQLADLLHTLALNDIQTHTVELPVGPHGGRFGELMGNDYLARVEGLRARVIGARVATSDEFTQAQNALRQEMERMEYILPVYVVYGRR